MLRHFRAEGTTPLYVLPLDVKATSSFFAPHVSAAVAPAGKAM
jgi:hypothetical protein